MTPPDSTTQYLDRPDGRIAYDVTGDGPLVVCAPGMGDLRSVYRHLTPHLVAAGYRVATMDLRGHGDSDTSFTTYGHHETAGDLLALTERLGGPAVLVGNSMSAGSAVVAAATRPDLVSGLTLIGPFVRAVPMNPLMIAAFRLALTKPWGPAVWRSYYAKLYPAAPPADIADHQRAIAASLKRPGGWKAFVATTKTSHDAAEAHLDGVTAPSLVVMGSADPDFPDPRGEAELIASRLDGTAVVLPDLGHYPQAEAPEVTATHIIDFLRTATDREATDA